MEVIEDNRHEKQRGSIVEKSEGKFCQEIQRGCQGKVEAWQETQRGCLS